MIRLPIKNKQKARTVLGLLGFVLIVSTALPVFAQSDDINNRLRRMENEVSTLSRAVYKGETPPPGSFSSGASAADTEIRIQQLENDIRDLRGKTEEQSFQLQQIRNDLDRITGDMELRLKDLEGGGAPSGSSAPLTGDVQPYTDGAATPPQAGSSAGSSGYSWGTNNTNAADAGAAAEGGAVSSPSGQLGAYGGSDAAADLYESAFSLLKDNNYEQAQTGFQSFMDQYPEHALAGNAKYWLGETYYVRGKYEESTRIFAEGYKKYPKSAKSADNLLKLGLSLDALGKKNEACIAFRQLTKENTTGSAPVLRRAEQEMTRLSC
jgi:tol-pal system protein YbgF